MSMNGIVIKIDIKGYNRNAVLIDTKYVTL